MVTALRESFDVKLIDRTKKEPRKATKRPSDEQDKGGQTTQSITSPQKKGQEIHLSLAKKIKEHTRDDTGGKMLKEIEETFGCEFIKEEVRISGYAIKTLNLCGKPKRDFWRGKMDAVAIRRTEEGVLEVFVVDWKTSGKADEQLIYKWWEKAANFKDPLYQCLVYRELLQAHFEHNDVKAKVGIMLVPFHQSNPEITRPGLCVDFRKMGENLLDGLKKFEWYAVLDESFDVHTIKIPCKLIKDSFNPADYVDERTNNLKGDTRLKDVLNDNATVADLCLWLDLPYITVEGIKKEEKTNEDLEEVNKKC